MTDYLADYDSILFLGGGCMAERLFNQINGIEHKLVGVMDLFSDTNRKIKSFHNFEIKSPDAFENEINSGAAIIVAIGTIEVCKYVNEFINKYNIPEANIFVVNPYSSLRFFMVNDDFSAEERIPLSDKRFEEVCQMFKDKTSIEIIEFLKAAKPYESVNDTYELIKYSSIKEMFFYQEDYWNTLSFEENIKYDCATVIDCGAYIGDSIETVCKTIPESAVIYHAIEPLHENVLAIKNNPVFKDLCSSLYVHECGVGKNNEIMYFSVSNNNLDGGRFVNSEDSASLKDSLVIKSLDSMDLVIQGQLYIKMDIEGAELDAIKGAKEIISKYRPYLAVCLYHRKNDIIEIPYYLKNTLANYSFYLRGGYHTIIWAIPNRSEV